MLPTTTGKAVIAITRNQSQRFGNRPNRLAYRSPCGYVDMGYNEASSCHAVLLRRRRIRNS
eukprot:1725710-Alexandrium_andersonii.AAC.1